MKFSIEEMQSYLPLFIDAEYKKGKDKDRGTAILAVALFLMWLKNNVKKK